MKENLLLKLSLIAVIPQTNLYLKKQNFVVILIKHI